MNVGNPIPNLDKILREDDESEFLPSGGSNLAAIFGSQVKTLDSCSSVKQVPKKLNTTRALTQTVSNKTEVIIAKAVYAFKLQNGSYISIGKLGMALTANVARKVYQIILYKNKQEHVSVVTLTHDFFYIIQLNNYSSYYDNNKENWTIAFENNDVCTEFAREIGLARYFLRTGTLENVLYQDLSPTNKDVTAKEGDNVHIKYFITTEITQPLRNNPSTFQTMMVEISTDDNWEKTLLGSNMGLKRLLFLPPSKQISLGPGFPKEKDVLLEIEIVDIQTPEETNRCPKIGSGKASIISRMAKMGQSILPKLPSSSTTESEDTEVDLSEEELKKSASQECKEEIRKSAHRLSKSKSDVPVTNTASKPFINSSVYTSQWPSTQMQQNFLTLDGQVYSLQSQAVPPAIPTLIDPGLNMLLSETRMANAELRMGMSKIVENMQKLLDKFHVLELQNATSPIKDKATLEATLKMLLNMNISEERANQSHKNTNIVADNCKELNEMRHRINVLEEELKESKKYTKDLETQKKSLIETNESLSKTIKELETSLKYSNVKKNSEEVQKSNGKDEGQAVSLESKILKLSEECSIAEEVTSSMEAKENDSRNKEIKHIMNKIYHVLLDKFVDESYSTVYIRAIIASTIKNVTLQVLYSTSENSDVESEAASNRSIETDILKTDSTELTEVSSLSCIEPPPIPPIDSEDNSN
ncbi:FK506-binding protein 15 [Anthophora plagiata]